MLTTDKTKVLCIYSDSRISDLFVEDLNKDEFNCKVIEKNELVLVYLRIYSL